MRIREKAEHGTRKKQSDTDTYSHRFFHFSRCQRPVAFYGMFSVVLNVPVVIYDINRRCNKTKGNNSFH